MNALNMKNKNGLSNIYFMSGEKRKQHYDPQFYLREFSESGNIVFCYDKTVDKCYPINVSNICAENGFYNLIDEENKEIEDAFGLLENLCSKTHKKILKDNFDVLNLGEKSLYVFGFSYFTWDF
jgi:hypothetical protein